MRGRTQEPVTSTSATVAPGSVVIVRDEEWLVTSTETTDDVTLLLVQGLSEFVRGTSATFYDSLDDIEVADPATAQLVADDSSSYRRARFVAGGHRTQNANAAQ